MISKGDEIRITDRDYEGNDWEGRYYRSKNVTLVVDKIKEHSEYPIRAHKKNVEDSKSFHLKFSEAILISQAQTTISENYDI